MTVQEPVGATETPFPAFAYVYAHFYDCRTNEASRREVLLTYEDSRVIKMHGGPTGYESLIAADYIEHDNRTGWMACFGTPGRWDQCFVPEDQMRDALRRFGLVE